MSRKTYNVDNGLYNNSHIIVNKYFSNTKDGRTESCTYAKENNADCPLTCKFYSALDDLCKKDEHKEAYEAFTRFIEFVKSKEILSSPEKIKRYLKPLLEAEIPKNNNYKSFNQDNFNYFPVSHNISIGEYLGHTRIDYRNISSFIKRGSQCKDICYTGDEVYMESKVQEISNRIFANK